MYSVAIFCQRIIQRFSYFSSFSRVLWNQQSDTDGTGNGFVRIEDHLNESWKCMNFDNNLKDKSEIQDSVDFIGTNGCYEGHFQQNVSSWHHFIEKVKNEASTIIEILQEDDNSHITVSSLLVREVLLGILKKINYANKNRCAKLGYKFFLWSGQQENYRHTTNSYHLIMKIFAESEELKAMWRLVDEMTVKGYPTTARTFNLLICTCGEAGLARNVVERFIKSKTFNYRPLRHSFNAILHSLLGVNQYRLIEWVYRQMLVEGHLPDILTYNIMLCSKYRLAKLDQFHTLLDGMGQNGFSPDFHTFNILLHVLGKGDKPLAAVNLLNHMKEVGCEPSILHFTTLIDGLSRAGNLDACKYFFEEMIWQRCVPDFVCYTVMITGYVVAGELDKAKELFTDMIVNGQLPNVFTYNSMIRGLCMAEKFDEACMMVKEMESRGCNPNFMVYSTLVTHEVIRHMVDKGQYIHLVSKFKRYRRC
ncbi:unnamed protein product [Withania somnifera]